MLLTDTDLHSETGGSSQSMVICHHCAESVGARSAVCHSVCVTSNAIPAGQGAVSGPEIAVIMQTMYSVHACDTLL